MRNLIAGDSQRGLDANYGAGGGGGSGGKAQSSRDGWLTPSQVLTCPRCQGNLIGLDAVLQAARRLPRFPFWRPDTRRIMARCATCGHFHLVFTYPIFNWIPPERLTAEMTLLNVLIAALILCAALPHYSVLSLLSL